MPRRNVFSGCPTVASKRGRSKEPGRVQGDPRVDRAAAAELAASEKDRAENVMIVDLLRNDLARVCVAESVK